MLALMNIIIPFCGAPDKPSGTHQAKKANENTEIYSHMDPH